VRTSVADSKWTVERTPRPPVRLPRLGDERLARLAARGSTRAFAAVYERYHQPLYRYCRSIVRDDADAQDAVQSTFAGALTALQRGQRSAPLRPWLFRIAHNEAISVLRRRRRVTEEPLDAAAIGSAASAEDQAGERARLEVLMGDLAALPDRARSALVMRELSGLSHEEIAIALDTSDGAAKQAIFEARRGLVECAEGRAMPCAEVCRAVSDGDGRVLRSRRVRAHLRDCAACAAFAASIKTRKRDLRALTPVPPMAGSIAVLSGATQTAIVATTSKGLGIASLLATAAVSVGGVAAVVRLAPDTPHRVVNARAMHATPASPAPHVQSRGSARVRASAPARGTAQSALGRTTHTAGGGRHVRFSPWHGDRHGRHRAMFTHGGRGWHRVRSVARHRAARVPVVRRASLEGYAGERGGHHHKVGPDVRRSRASMR
jgi:RNA polymerase sigma factor (sigma-70 family)